MSSAANTAHAVPARLAQLPAPKPGLASRKVNQLRTIATASQDGALSRQQLRTMTYPDGLAHLQQLPGIGPFSAELILIRGVGHTDALPDHDTGFNKAIRSTYKTTDDAAIRSITDSWRPPRMGRAPAQSMARGRDQRDRSRPTTRTPSSG